MRDTHRKKERRKRWDEIGSETDHEKETKREREEKGERDGSD